MNDAAPFTAAITKAAAIIRDGGLVAHATEGVFGLACDPTNDQALARLLQLKDRPSDKGLIVIAADAQAFAQELGALTPDDRAGVLSVWPGAHTFLVPNTRFGPLVAGTSGAVAIRVPGHPQARALAAAVGGPLTSTSANPAESVAAVTADEVNAYFGAKIDFIVPGEVLTPGQPSSIRDLRTGAVVRGVPA